jgi:hypothetical protein
MFRRKSDDGIKRHTVNVTSENIFEVFMHVRILAVLRAFTVPNCIFHIENIKVTISHLLLKVKTRTVPTPVSAKDAEGHRFGELHGRRSRLLLHRLPCWFMFRTHINALVRLTLSSVLRHRQTPSPPEMNNGKPLTFSLSRSKVNRLPQSVKVTLALALD